jgi:hypothetical protein
MPLHKFDYIFAIGTIFSFLDAWNIGTFPPSGSIASCEDISN